MLKTLGLSAVLSLTFSAYAMAQNSWSGEASLTGGKTTGNTETEHLSLGLKLKKDDDKWHHKFHALADYGKVSGTKNRQKIALGYQIDRDISERVYVYANADYFSDDFGAYSDGGFLGAGLGYKVVVPEPIAWNLEAGAGYRSQDPRGFDFLGNPLGRTNEFALKGASDFDFAINDKVSLYNDTEVVWSDSDTNIWNETGLNATLMGALAARISYRIDHHSDVPAGRKKTDTAARFGVVYTID